MRSYLSGARLTALVLSLAALQACVDERSPVAPDAAACRTGARGCGPQPGDVAFDITPGVITVTSTSGGTEVGSLRWAIGQAADNDTIRFDPSLAGQTITLEETVQSGTSLVIEGPADEGIVISGGGQRRMFILFHTANTPAWAVPAEAFGEVRLSWGK